MPLLGTSVSTGFVHGLVVASAQVSLVITTRPEQGESVCADSLVPGGGVLLVAV